MRCRLVDADGPLARLKKAIFNPELYENIAEWIVVSWKELSEQTASFFAKIRKWKHSKFLYSEGKITKFKIYIQCSKGICRKLARMPKKKALSLWTCLLLEDGALQGVKKENAQSPNSALRIQRRVPSEHCWMHTDMHTKHNFPSQGKEGSADLASHRN